MVTIALKSSFHNTPGALAWLRSQRVHCKPVARLRQADSLPMLRHLLQDVARVYGHTSAESTGTARSRIARMRRFG